MDARFLTSRRSVLAGMTAVAGSLTLGRPALGILDTPPGQAESFVARKSGKVVPFPMTQVPLSDGLFKAQSEINQTYLASLNTDRVRDQFSREARERTRLDSRTGHH